MHVQVHVLGCYRTKGCGVMADKADEAEKAEVKKVQAYAWVWVVGGSIYSCTFVVVLGLSGSADLGGTHIYN